MGDHPFRMKVEKGAKKTKKFPVRDDALVIGSGSEADILIDGPGVEPRHAEVVMHGGQVRLSDLGTQGGTFRNGQRLLGPVQVFPGDRIGLGPHVVLVLEGDGSEGETAEEEETSGSLGLASDDGGGPA